MKKYLKSSNKEDESILAAYFREIQKIPLLTAEEEREIGEKAMAGDEAARKKLTESNLQYVVNIAKKYSGCELSFEDLICEGNVGLIRAAEKYDVRKGRFTTYSTYWIKQSILKALYEKGKTIRIPAKTIGKIIEAERLMLQGKSLGEVSDTMKISKEEIKYLMVISDVGSLDDFSEEVGEEGITIKDKVADFTYSPERLFEEETPNLLTCLGGIIDSRSLDIMQMLHGFKDSRVHTLREVGAKYGIVRQRVKQLEEKTLIELRLPRKNFKYADFL